LWWLVYTRDMHHAPDDCGLNSC